MQIVVVALLLPLLIGAQNCDHDPDHTNEGLYYTDCRAGTPLVINSIAVVNDDGSTNYPIYVDAPLNIILNMTNTAHNAWDNIYVSIDIARYTNIFGICSWIGIPTFGLLDHLDACHIGETSICPLKPGLIVVKDRINLSLIQGILDFMSASEPYRLTMTFTSHGIVLSCTTVEGKIRKD